MSVDTKQAFGRRTLSYQSYDDLLADAEQLAGGEVTMVGNWSLGQSCKHLAEALNASIDGTDFKMPWIMKTMARLLMKNKMLNNTLSPGFKIPESDKAKFEPSPTITTEEGLDALRAAIERCKSEEKRAPHPAFGQLSREDYDKFNQRHAELHMSFAVPAS